MPTASYRLLIALVAAAFLAFAVAAPASAAGNSLTLTAANTGAADRVTLAFTGQVPAFNITADSNPPFGIGSGRDMPIGDSTFYVHLDCPMSCWSGQITNQVPFETLPQVRGALAQNFEGELRVDIGLAHQTGWSVSTQGSNIVVTAPH
jgi:hypothetical protein